MIPPTHAFVHNSLDSALHSRCVSILRVQFIVKRRFYSFKCLHNESSSSSQAIRQTKAPIPLEVERTQHLTDSVIHNMRDGGYSVQVQNWSYTQTESSYKYIDDEEG